MGGPTAEEHVRAVGEDEAGEQVEQETPEGSEPEGGAEEQGEEPSPRKGDNAAYVASLEDQLRKSDAIARIIQSDPERLKMFEKWVRAENGEADESDDPLAGIAGEVDQRFERPEDRAAVHAFLDPVLAQVRALRREMQELRPKVGAAHNAVVTSEVARTLASSGVSEEVQRTREFQKFMAAQRADRDVARDLAKRPSYAARNLAAHWIARNGRAQSNVAERQRTNDLKGGRFHAGAPVGSGASKVVTIDKSQPGWDVAALNARMKTPGVQIRYTGGATK